MIVEVIQVHRGDEHLLLVHIRIVNKHNKYGVRQYDDDKSNEAKGKMIIKKIIRENFLKYEYFINF